MSLTTDLSSADPRRGDNTISPWTELKESPANGIPLGDIEVWTHMILDDQYTNFYHFNRNLLWSLLWSSALSVAKGTRAAPPSTYSDLFDEVSMSLVNP